MFPAAANFATSVYESKNMSLTNRLRDVLRQLSKVRGRRCPRRNFGRQRTVLSGLAVEQLETKALLATFSVTNLDDAGSGSLRQAIEDSNVKPGADTIDATGVSGTIVLTSGQLNLTDPVTLNGPGQNRLTISGNNANRVMSVGSSNAGDFHISDVRIANGSEDTGEGAGILFSSSSNRYFVSRVTVENNHANGGGGIAVAGQGGLRMKDSAIINNTANFNGSAIIFFGGSDNWLMNSTISGNSGNSTIQQQSGDSVTSNVRLRNLTVADNTGLGFSTFAVGSGTIYSEVQNTIFADNTNGNITTFAEATADNTFLSRGHNLSDDNSAGLTSSSDWTNTNPLIGPLQNNGGPSPTHALLAGSPAIDSGDNAVVDSFATPFLTDQRQGPFLRSYDGNGNGFVTIDIGATEYYGEMLVDTTTDATDDDYSPGNFTLREAVAVANAQPGAETITFAAALNGGAITLTEGELRVIDSLNINGPGAANLAISGGDASQIFWLGSNNTSEAYEISGVTLRNGNGVNSSRISGFGGAISFFDEFVGDDVLTISDAVLTDNTSDLGGAIYALKSELNITNTIIDNNTATGTSATRGGGGIALQSANATLTNTTVSNNTASSTGGGIYNFTFSGAVGFGNTLLTINGGSISDNSATFGGGIYNENQNVGEFATANLHEVIVSGNMVTGSGGGIWNNSTALIEDSVIRGNTASGFGGGIRIEGPTVVRRSEITENQAFQGGGIGSSSDQAISRFENVTISGNKATIVGGAGGAGVYAFDSKFLFTNSTITNNIIGDGTSAAQGAGIFIDPTTNPTTNPAEVELSNSIVAGNVSTGTGVDVAGTILVAQNSLIESNTGFSITSASGTNLLGGAPLLGPLQNNGGPTKTHALLPGSPAIDAGDNARATDSGSNVFVTDQRGAGYLRIISASANGGATVDMGAFEAPFAGDLIVSTTSDTVDGDYSDGQLSLREAILVANQRSGQDTITFSSTMSGTNIQLAGTELVITGDTFVTGPGSANLTIDGMGTSRVLRITAGAAVSISGLSITGGDATNSTDNDAIYDGLGGGVFNEGGQLQLMAVRIHGNTGTYGAGINNYGDNGGTATLVLRDSILDHNTSTENGGGLYNWGNGGNASAVVFNSTLSANTATYSGSGMINWAGIGIASLNISNSTVTTNISVNSLNTGALAIFGGDVTLNNTIVAGNLAAGSPGDVFGAIDSASANNLIGSGDSLSGTSNGLNGNQIGTSAALIDAMLGPLQDNGGPTQTHALLPGSPAIDGGDNAAAVDNTGTPLTTDQRQLPRLVGTVDIGAVEFRQPTLSLNIASKTFGENGGATTATVTRAGDADTSTALTVSLSSSDNGEATVPTSVTIPAGQSESAPFNIVAVDDAINDGTQTVTVTASASGYVDALDSVDVTDDDNAVSGDVDGDNDFDASDAFLIHLTKLSGTDAQIEESKGSSPLTAAQIRTRINQLGLAADVDGDLDFDASDSFLMLLVKLSGGNAQIDQSKGASPLTAVQIRWNVDRLNESSGSPPLGIAGAVISASVLPKSEPIENFVVPIPDAPQALAATGDGDVPEDNVATVMKNFRSWIDAI